MDSPENDRSLYDRIGGEAALGRLIDHFYHRVIHDGEIGHYFAHVPVEKVKHMQREFLAMATGGTGDLQRTPPLAGASPPRDQPTRIPTVHRAPSRDARGGRHRRTGPA